MLRSWCEFQAQGQKKKGCQTARHRQLVSRGERGRRLTALSQLNRRHWRSSPYSQHLHQILAPRAASIVHVVRSLLRALGRQFIQPINELGIAATLLNEAAQSITSIAPAFVAGHAQHIELADEIAEYDCAVARPLGV